MISKNQVNNPAQNPGINPNYIPAQMNFIFRARMLWRDLASWLRTYAVSLFAGIGDLEAVSQRLYRIPVEYGMMFKVFFGDQVTEQYIALLSDYIVLMESLFAAQKNNDINAVNNLTNQLYQNVNNTAAFLSSINSFWTESEWMSLMTSFTSMNLDLATALLTKNYTQYINIYDRILALTNIIGDYFSEGLNYYLNLKAPQQAT